MLVPLAGAALAVLGLVWPENDEREAPPTDEVAAPLVAGRPPGRRAELQRLIRAPFSSAPLPLPSVDFHGVVRSSKTGALLDDPGVEWGMAAEGKCEGGGIDWQDVTWEDGDDGFIILRHEIEATGALCLKLDHDGYTDQIVTMAQGKWPSGRPGLTLRLAPQSVLRGRALDQEGKPRAEVEISVYRVDERSAADTATTAKDGSYTLSVLDAGAYLVAADSYNTTHASFAEVTLQPGEVRRLDLRERAVTTLALRGKVVDLAGKPVSRVALSITPRAKARSPLERYQLIQAEDMSTWRAGAFEAEVGRAGWYRVRLHDESGSEPALGQADVYVDGKQPEPTIVYRGKVITCTLHDAAGRQVGLRTSYNMTVRRGCTTVGMGFLSGGSRGPVHPDLRFPWPRSARSVRLTLHGQNGLSGSVTLDSPDAACRAQGK